MTVQVAWIPLGAGSRVVPACGRIYESLCALRDRRSAKRIVHAALTIKLDDRAYTIEMAPAWGVPPGDRGIRRTGPVGSAMLGRSRFFRYEIRCWRDGVIPDIAAALVSQTIAATPTQAQQVLDSTAAVPALVWGRRPTHVTDMWNSNSVVAWLLATSGVDVSDGAGLPPGARAPGWNAGLALAGDPDIIR